MTRFGKIAEIAVGVGDARGARRAEPRHQFVAHRVDIGLGVLAVDRNPLRHRPAAVIRIVGGQMAVAQIAAEAARRQQLALRRRDVDAGIAHVVEPGRVRGNQMIVVDAVLDQKLPVRPDVVFLRAGNDLHLARRRLVDDEIDIFLRLAEIGCRDRSRRGRNWRNRNRDRIRAAAPRPSPFRFCRTPRRRRPRPAPI